jgi:Uma2 family endonuclease
MVSVPSRVPAHLPPPRPGIHLRMSYEEFLVWSPDNMWAEWKDGEAIVFMSMTPLHQQIIARLFVLLSLFVRARDLGIVRPGPILAKLWPEGPAREPDVTFISHARMAALGDIVYSGGPDLMVEVISPDSVHRDRVEKREEYARAGVREYWVIEARAGVRRRRAVLVYRLDGAGQYGPPESIREGVLRSTVLPGFWMQVEWLWQEEEPDAQALLAAILRYPEGPESPEAPESVYIQPWVTPMLQEGFEQGRAEGLRTSIRLLAASRFGSVSSSLEQILQGMSREDDLTALLQRVLTAAGPDELSL